jgi:hypothetical protein
MASTGRSASRGVTRDVEPSTLSDLLEHPPRATVAFVDQGHADVLPVRARCRADSYRFGVPAGVIADFQDREVVLLMDDGAYWFELRGISIRGVARRIEPGATDGLVWYAIAPRRVLAWDYCAVRPM